MLDCIARMIGEHDLLRNGLFTCPNCTHTDFSIVLLYYPSGKIRQMNLYCTACAEATVLTDGKASNAQIP